MNKLDRSIFMEYFLADGMTIMSGGIAERVRFSGHGICRHYIYSFDLLYHGFVVLGAGFIGEFSNTSFFAYAGIDIVIPGGIGDLLGATIAGRRDGRFDGLDLKGRLF